MRRVHRLTPQDRLAARVDGSPVVRGPVAEHSSLESRAAVARLEKPITAIRSGSMRGCFGRKECARQTSTVLASSDRRQSSGVIPVMPRPERLPGTSAPKPQPLRARAHSSRITIGSPMHGLRCGAGKRPPCSSGPPRLSEPDGRSSGKEMQRRAHGAGSVSGAPPRRGGTAPLQAKDRSRSPGRPSVRWGGLIAVAEKAEPSRQGRRRFAIASRIFSVSGHSWPSSLEWITSPSKVTSKDDLLPP